MNIATVLKTGGDYLPEHVISLYEQIKKHNPDAVFYCLTDTAINHPGINEIPLKYCFKGWWSKLELFAAFYDKPVIYLDLDTVVMGDISFLQSTGLTMLKDFYNHHGFGSGVMSWHGDYRYFIEDFIPISAKVMARYRTHEKLGDQAFIRDFTKHKIETFSQDGSIVSYKVHVKPKNKVPHGAKVLCFHGKPRPWCNSVKLVF